MPEPSRSLRWWAEHFDEVSACLFTRIHPSLKGPYETDQIKGAMRERTDDQLLVDAMLEGRYTEPVDHDPRIVPAGTHHPRPWSFIAAPAGQTRKALKMRMMADLSSRDWNGLWDNMVQALEDAGD